MNAWTIRGLASIGFLALASLHCSGGKQSNLGPDSGLFSDGSVTSGTYVNVFQEEPNRKVDILFMIDNSSSMETSQATFVAGLPPFMNILKALPGGLPDLHIGVVTSDMGAGDNSISQCMGNGNNGVLQNSRRSTCADTTLQTGATFISDTGGANPQTNFQAADITTVLQCIAPVGASGCGFEHQLASVARALGADGQAPPQENQGFLRTDATLAVVLLSNEDDCSAPVNSVLFDTNVNTNLASQVGPPGNYRCNEFGHLCGSPAKKPPRLSPMPSDLTTTVTLDGCVSAEDQGMLPSVAKFAQGLKALKADPDRQIMVVSIQGPATPYVVHWSTPPIPDTGPWPSIVHSCTSGTGIGFADPGVRLQQFVQQFGANGLTFNICETDYTPALGTIATKLAGLMSAANCYQAVVRSKDASGATFDPDCVVTEQVRNGQGTLTSTVLPACAHNGSAPPCWALETPPPLSCPSGSHVVVVNRSAAPPSGALISVECSVCPAGSTDPSCF